MRGIAIAIVQARMSSRRLPRKVLRPLAGHAMLWHVVQRARRCALVGDVVVATSNDPSDDELVEFCRGQDIPCHRGSLNDVLSRFIQILDHRSEPYCVRITADCPLIHPPIIDAQIQVAAAHDADLVWLDPPSTLFEGQSVHSARSLRRVAEFSSHPDDREHVGSRYFAEYPEAFRIVGLTLPDALGKNGYRITVDEEADYALMAALHDALWTGQQIISLDDAVTWLDSHPEVAMLNRTVDSGITNRTFYAKRARWAQHLVQKCVWGEGTPV